MKFRTHITIAVSFCLLLVIFAAADDTRRARPAKPTQYLRSDSAFFALKSWESTGKADGKFYNITGVEFHQNGNIYTAHPGLDEYSRVQIFDPNGKFLDWFGGYQSDSNPEDDMKSPTGIAVCPNGNIYIGETLGNSVRQFTSEGKFIQYWGLPGRFMSRAGCIAVDRNGDVYTADPYNGYLYKHTNKGKLLWEKGLSSEGFGASSPQSVTTSPDGNLVYLADSKATGIRVFDSETGKELKQFSGSASLITGPWSLDCRSDGSLVVVDPNEDEVLIHLISSGGARLSLTKFKRPDGRYNFHIAANLDGTIAVVAGNSDTAYGKITFYRNSIYKPADGTAKIKGKVKGLSGDALANLVVRIDGVQDGVPFFASVRPNTKGKFAFTRFPGGVDFTVILLGYDTTKYSSEPVEGTAAGGTQKVTLQVKK